MPDILIRGLPEDVVAALDAAAQRRGISRNEYLSRVLANEARTSSGRKVTIEDFKRFSETFADALDPEIMKGAWHHRERP
ncbi:MAG: antitoxin [Acidimicrobiia bacterium]